MLEPAPDWLQLRGFNDAMACLARRSQWQSALALLCRLGGDVISYTSVIKGCGAWSQALQVYGMLATKALEPNLVTVNVLLTSLAGEQWRSSSSILRRLQLWAVRPDGVTLGAKVQLLRAAQLWQSALEELVPEAVVLSAIIETCSEAAQWQRALAAMPRGTRDPVLCNSALNACAAVAEWQHALDLLSEGVASGRDVLF